MRKSSMSDSHSKHKDDQTDDVIAPTPTPGTVFAVPATVSKKDHKELPDIDNSVTFPSKREERPDKDTKPHDDSETKDSTREKEEPRIKEDVSVLADQEEKADDTEGAEESNPELLENDEMESETDPMPASIEPHEVIDDVDPVDADEVQISDFEEVETDTGDNNEVSPVARDSKKQGALAVKQAAESSPSKSPAVKKKFSRKKMAIIAALIMLTILLLAGGGVFAYQQLIQPRLALSQYLEFFEQNEENVESFRYESNVKGEIKANDSVDFDFIAKGAVDSKNKDKSLASFDIKGTVDSPSTSKNRSGTPEGFDEVPPQGSNTVGFKFDAESIFIANDKQATYYLNIHQPELINEFLPGLLDKWVYTSTDELTAQDTDAVCSPEKLEKIYAFGAKRFGQMEITNARRIGMLPEQVEGTRAPHFRGELTGKELSSALRAIEKRSHEICPDDFVKPSKNAGNEFKNYNFTYDIWQNNQFSKIAVFADNKKDKIKLNFSFTTKDYNDESINIKAPNGATSLQELMRSAISEDLDDLFEENIETEGSAPVVDEEDTSSI